MTVEKLYIGILIGVLIYFLYSKMFTSKKSGFTMQPFSTMTDREEATNAFQSQMAQVAAELASKLAEAISAGKTTQELIDISNSYSDQTNDLTKAFSAWQLHNRPATGAGTQAPVSQS